MSEIIRLGAENPPETQNFFKGVAEKYKDPNNQKNTLHGFSTEIREKLNIKGPSYVPGHDFSQAIIEHTLRKDLIDRRGGLQKTSEGFLSFIEGMGINPQDPSVPLERLAKEYLLRPYVTKVHSQEEAAAIRKRVEAARKTPMPQEEVHPPTPATTRSVQTPPPAGTETEGAEAPMATAKDLSAGTETQPVSTEEAPQSPEILETPAQRESRIRRMLAGLSDFLSQPGQEATALRERLAGADRETFETLRQAIGSLASKFPSLFRRTPQEEAKEVKEKATEAPEKKEGKIIGILRGVNEFLAQPGEETARLRDADRQASEDLRTALGSLARKVPDLFRRRPGEILEPEAGLEAPLRRETGVAGETTTMPGAQILSEDEIERFRELSTKEHTNGVLEPEEEQEFSKLEKKYWALSEADQDILRKRNFSEETPTQREGRIRRMLAGVNDFLAQPSDEAERLRQADREAFETLQQAVQSLAAKVPNLFAKPTPEEAGEARISGEQKPSNVIGVLKGINEFLAQPGEEAARLRQQDSESFETMVATVKKFPTVFERIFRKGAEEKPKETALTPEEQRVSRVRRMLGGLSDFLAQPGEEATRLRERLAAADRETFETLTKAIGSLAGKAPELFRRRPEEVEAEAAEEPEKKEGKIRRVLRGVNEFLAQPSDEAERLRQADREASESLRTALGSLARKVPDLFRTPT